MALSRLRQLRATQQVAAVCYRMNGGNLEFLLVRTRGGRWIFPKGSAEAGLTHAEAAALEAFEEAGVHGRMEIDSFTQYLHKRGRGVDSSKVLTSAHLCQVTRLGHPRESHRKPSWFPAVQAKLRLREDRSSGSGAELARVIDRAVARIQQLHTLSSPVIEELQRVRFEAFSGRLASRIPLFQVAHSPLDRLPRVSVPDPGQLPGVCEVLEFRTAEVPTPSAQLLIPSQPKALGEGSARSTKDR
jgi:8-oxo-dGTP pyrophosphatase MutT (NUDIX family)